MGLRCSLLGHKYGEPETERDREERGDEVVVTVSAVKTCTQCGNRAVVAVNKEVTAIEQPTDNDAEGDDVTDDGSTADASTSVQATQDGEHDDAEILDADDEPETREREYGEWPDHAEVQPATDDEPRAPAEWPDVDGEDEGFSAEVVDGEVPDVRFEDNLVPTDVSGGDDSGEIIEPESVEPSRPADDAARTPRSSRRESGPDARRTDTPPKPSPAEPDEITTEFTCPECGFVEGVAGSSLRAGDICPECGRGYLDEREP